MGCDESLHRSFLLTKLTCYNSQLTTEHIYDFPVVVLYAEVFEYKLMYIGVSYIHCI